MKHLDIFNNIVKRTIIERLNIFAKCVPFRHLDFSSYLMLNDISIESFVAAEIRITLRDIKNYCLFERLQMCG